MIPSGFTSGQVAEQACEAAGKRLCSLDEWTHACKGERATKFPYGDRYQHGRCNVYRFVHPAALLHGNASVGHLDPRLNRVEEIRGSQRLAVLRPGGTTPQCASHWGDDAVHDMVGNLDEWVEKKGGAFAGGFYARLTRSGCDAVISVHPRRYLDYSLGTRCCSAAE
jgi:formylglycine-generating enzyme required for sulfatase activity